MSLQRRWLRITLVAVSTMVAVAVCPLSASGRGSAVPSGGGQQYQLTAVGGSSRYLVYTVFPVVDGKRQDLGKLYALGLSGKRVRLGSITSLEAAGASASGHFAFAPVKGSKSIDLWNLASGRSFVLKPPTGETPGEAAPDGYLAERVGPSPSDPFILSTVTPAGDVRPLGNPFPGGQSYDPLDGSSSYIAFVPTDEQAGGIRTGRFDQPGKVTTLLAPGHRDASFCGPPSATLVACRLNSAHQQLRLYSLKGGIVVSTSRHCNQDFLPAPNVLGDSMVWLGCHHHLAQLTPSGRFLESHSEFANVTPVHALHQIVLSSRSRTTLIGLSRADGTPTNLASVKPA